MILSAGRGCLPSTHPCAGVTEGATTAAGGGRHGDSGYFVEPAVITNTRPDMKIVREEIFGRACPGEEAPGRDRLDQLLQPG
jgi:Aldehyde dehydrogenase family